MRDAKDNRAQSAKCRDNSVRELWRDLLHSTDSFDCLTTFARSERKKGAYFLNWRAAPTAINFVRPYKICYTLMLKLSGWIRNFQILWALPAFPGAAVTFNPDGIIVAFGTLPVPRRRSPSSLPPPVPVRNTHGGATQCAMNHRRLETAGPGTKTAKKRPRDRRT